MQSPWLRRLAVVAVAIAAIAFVVFRATRAKPVAVVLGEATRGRVERSVANTRAGTIEACRRAKLAPAAGGQIVALPVKEGERVTEGQVLLELWSDDAAAQARAAVEQERSAVLRADEACLQADVAERDAKRAEQLHGDGLLPFETFDRATANAKALRAACAGATADIRRSRASLDAARATLTRTLLRAPFAGIVAKINGELGEFTTPSPPGIPTLPAVDLIDDSCLYVSAPIDEVDVARVRIGQSAWVTLEAIPGKRLAGRVRRIAPYVLDLEKQARTVDVEVELTDPADLEALLVGYSADVEIILDTRENVVRVPTQALMEGSRAFLYEPGTGRLVEKRLETGLSNWEFTEVTSGLEPGAKLVLSVEREGVKDGAKVVPEPPRTQ